MAVATAAAVFVFGCTPSLIQLPVADALLRIARLAPPELPEGFPDVAIVTLDAQSMRAIPHRWPWPRSVYAEVIRRLDAAGAVSIAFDLDFSTRWDRAEDMKFARAIKKSKHVVLAAYREFQDLGEAGEIEIASVPAPEFSISAAAVGHVILELDRDGVIRRGARGRSIASREFPSLSEAAIDVALGKEPSSHANGNFQIDFRRVQPEVPTIGLADLLDDRFDPSLLRGRIVLVGATAVEFQDLWNTPIGPTVPGVYIQAIGIRTLIARRAGASPLRPVGQEAGLLALIGLSFLSAGIGSRGQRVRVLGLGSLAIATAGISLLLLIRWGLFFEPVLPLGVIAAHYVLSLENVQAYVGRLLAERERSLSTLLEVGEAAADLEAQSSLDLALSLVGEMVAASAVALLRTDSQGKLAPQRLTWQRGPWGQVGDLELAREVLAGRKTQVFPGRIPGRSRRSGVAIYSPLIAGESVLGIMVVEREGPRELDRMHLKAVLTVATQLALSIANLRLLDSLKHTFSSSIEAIASAVEARDGYTEKHCRRLAAFSMMMAERLGLSPDDIEAIRLGALLHDVGKIGIRDAVLLKATRLTEQERAKIEEHPGIGHGIIRSIEGLSPLTAACVRNHHEHWDGSGYPDGLAGEAIPIGARIVTIVDVWDALSSQRPYKPALGQRKVRSIMEKKCGNHFDPDLLALFFTVLDEEGSEMIALIDRTSSDQEEPA